MAGQKLEVPSFIRPAEIMGSAIQTTFSKSADEVASLLAKGVRKKGGIKEAKALVAAAYKADGLDDANRKRLEHVFNNGANEVGDVRTLKSQKKRTDGIIDKVQLVVQKSAERYIERIVMPHVVGRIAKGDTNAEVEASILKKMADAEHYWKNVSNTATSRLHHYAGMLAAEKVGLRKGTYMNPKDEVTTDFCFNLGGKTITLANMVTKAEEVLEQSADEMLDTDYFSMVAEMGESGSLAIVTKGLTLPPFHGHCRTTIWFH